MSGILIRKLDDGFLVTDQRGPKVWEGAAVSLVDAENMARHRVHPWTAAPPPGPCLPTSGYNELHPSPADSGQEHAQGGHHLAAVQYAQATGDAECIGGICSLD